MEGISYHGVLHSLVTTLLHVVSEPVFILFGYFLLKMFKTLQAHGKGLNR